MAQREFLFKFVINRKSRTKNYKNKKFRESMIPLNSEEMKRRSASRQPETSVDRLKPEK